MLADIVAADVPTLNQNTTGTAAGLSSTLAISSGGTGQTSASAAITALTGTQTNKYYLRSNGTNATLSALDAADLAGTIPISVLSGSPTSAVYYKLNTTAEVTAVANPSTGYIKMYFKDDGLFYTRTSAGLETVFSSGGGSPTQVTFAESTASPNNMIFVDSMTAAGSATDVDLALRPKGNGALTAQVADNTTTGGNKRGLRAVDWQMGREDATMVASGNYSVIGGGRHNSATEMHSTVAGGYYNATAGIRSTIAGGQYNTIDSNGTSGVIGGGSDNSLTAATSVIAGGGSNTASAQATVISGGTGNTASAQGATIAGGAGNTASGYGTFIGGGDTNTASGTRAIVVGGSGNTATVEWATIGGGRDNTSTTGWYSVIPGGRDANAHKYAMLAHSSGKFAVAGDAQYELRVLRATTTDATTVKELTSTGITPLNSTNEGPVGFHGGIADVHSMTISVVANSAAVGTATPFGIFGASWVFDALTFNTTDQFTDFVSAPSLRRVQRHSALATCSVSLSTGGYFGMTIKVTGVANTSIHWVAVVTTTKVG